MDKQKQIEEMASCLIGKVVTGVDSTKVLDLGYITVKEISSILVNAGYRKIPENAVVLTGTETEERIEDLLVNFDEMSFFPLTLMPNPEQCAKEWKSKLIYAIGQLRKEIAEKFAERVKDELNEWLEYNESLDGTINFGVAMSELIGVKSLDGEVIAESLIDEICKEFTEGKNGKT